MTVVSVTRLRLRSVRFLLRLHWETWKIRRSLQKAPGFLRGKLLVDRKMAFWTMTIWRDVDSMLAFRDSPAHAAVMPKVGLWCDEASVVHWEAETDQLPTWKEAYRRMTESGKLSPLKIKSRDHEAHRFRKPVVSKSRETPIQPRMT